MQRVGDDDSRTDARAPADAVPVQEVTTVDLARYRARRMRARLLGILNGVLAAIERRDVERVVALLDDPEAYRCVPARVREEAIVIAQLPDDALRAPLRLYRYQYLLHRLSDEPLESPLDPGQLEVESAPAPPTSLRAAPGVRELSFTDRPVRERRAPNGGSRRGRRDRRRRVER